jgi:hypothetical protein
MSNSKETTERFNWRPAVEKYLNLSNKVIKAAAIS